MSRVVIELLIAVAIHAAVAWSLHAWGRWVAKRQGGTGWRYAAVMPIGGFWVAMIGIAVSAFLLFLTWKKTSNSDGGDKAFAVGTLRATGSR